MSLRGALHLRAAIGHARGGRAEDAWSRIDAATEDAEWTSYVYELAGKAPSFQQSWDQALSPAAAEELLNNIEQLFSLSITPEQFADNMNAVIGK